jgi:hypothetical protein
MVHLAQSSISYLNASSRTFGFVMRGISGLGRWQIAALNEADRARLNGNADRPTTGCGRPG